MTWLNNSRIIAIFAVVFLHTAARVVGASDIGSEYWWIGNLYDSFFRWCVPVFVMISGALLLDPNKSEDLKTFYEKRVSRILVPIIFWSAFYLLWSSTKGIIKDQPISWMHLAKKLLSGKPYAHMWFLYMIINLYLFTPFFRKINANSSRNEMYVMVIFAFLIAMINAFCMKVIYGESKLFLNWFLPYIPYFFAGYLIRTDNRNYPKYCLWSVFLFSVLLTAIGAYIEATNKDLHKDFYFYDNLSFSVIPMSLSAMYLLKSWKTTIINEKFTKTLSALTLGIYLIHPIFLEVIEYAGLGPLSLYPLVSIPIIAIIAFSSSLGGAWVIYQLPYLKRVI